MGKRNEDNPPLISSEEQYGHDGVLYIIIMWAITLTKAHLLTNKQRLSKLSFFSY
jgi:hypothetical protein